MFVLPSRQKYIVKQRNNYNILKIDSRSYKAENMLIHARKMHQLKGCKEDFFTNEDILKEQVDFINEHLAKASHK